MSGCDRRKLHPQLVSGTNRTNPSVFDMNASRNATPVRSFNFDVGPVSPCENNGIEQAKLLVTSIFDQITLGDAPPGNFDKHESWHSQVSVGGPRNGVVSFSSPRLPSKIVGNSRTISSGEQLNNFNDGVSTTGSEASVVSSVGMASFVSPKSSARNPPRASASHFFPKKDDEPISNGPTTTTLESSSSFGAALMGTLALADLCSRTVESVSCRKEPLEERNTSEERSSSPIRRLWTGNGQSLPPPPLSPLESEGSPPYEDDRKSLTEEPRHRAGTFEGCRNYNFPSDQDPTPRRHNGWAGREAVPNFDEGNVVVLSANNNAYITKSDEGFDVADMGNSTSWNEDHGRSSFTFEEVTTPPSQSSSLRGSWTEIDPPQEEKQTIGEELYAAVELEPSPPVCSPVPSQDTEGSSSPKRRMKMFGSEYARLLSSSSPLSPSKMNYNSSGRTRRPSFVVSNRIKSRFSSAASVSHSFSASSFGQSTKVSLESGGCLLLHLDNSPNSVLTAAITDIVVTYGNDAPPRGYYQAFQLVDDSSLPSSSSSVVSIPKNMVSGVRKRPRLYLNVKKEPNWDRAAQRPCVTAICVIYPDRNEFVPPGFSVVRQYQPGANFVAGGGKSISSNSSRARDGGQGVENEPGSVTAPANINADVSGERVYLCYRRSREGNPITGITLLRPSKGDIIPEGYTVLERTPRNFLANIACRAEEPVFMAYRQRLENLECLRPSPLVWSVFHSRPDDHSSFSRGGSRREMKAYYATGGAVISSDVGRYHIMDRSTHSLLSSSSAQSRLTLIQSSRKESTSAIPSWVNSTTAQASHPHRQTQTITSHHATQNNSLSITSEHTSHTSNQSDNSSFSTVFKSHADHETFGDGLSVTSFETALESSIFVKSPSHVSLASCGTAATSRSSPTPSLSRNPSPRSYTVFSHSDDTLQACFDAMDFIPPIECAQTCIGNGEPMHSGLLLQSRITVITPILTACYISQGGSALLAVEGLTSLLSNSNFFSPDVAGKTDTNCLVESSFRLTLLDLTIQVVCDVATSSARETYFRSCVDFVSDAVRLAGGRLNDRTIGFVLRFYLFVFYFGASVPSSGWPFNKEWHASKSGIKDDFLLSENSERFIGTETSLNGVYLPGGAPQAAAMALREFVSIMLARIGHNRHQSQGFGTLGDSGSPQTFARLILSHLIENAMNRVDVANYTQLALYQIHRSGGSELFWHDMIHSCGIGLFGQDTNSSQGVNHANVISFAILASFVKISSGKVRVISHSAEPVPRDVASKLLSLELLLHFIKIWFLTVHREDNVIGADGDNSAIVASARNSCEMESVATMVYVIRRLVVPTLLSNTAAAIEDSRVFRRVLRIISYLWCNPYYRRRMKIDLAVLIEHFVLKLLCLGPQVSYTPDTNGPEDSEKQRAIAGMPSLQHQQLDVLEEMMLWFSSNPKEVLDLFLNYDLDFYNQGRRQGDTLPAAYCKLTSKICEALCTLAEQCGAIIWEQSRFTSINGGRNSPINRKSASSPREGGVSDMQYARESAQLLREKSFKVIITIVKSMMDCAMMSQCDHEGSLSQNNSSSFDQDVSFGVSPQLSPHPNQRENENIVDYWHTSIERRKAPLQTPCTNEGGQTLFFPYDTSTTLRIKQSTSEDSSKILPSQQKQETLKIAFELISSKSLKKGLDYLIACHLLTPSPRDVASFLRIHQSSIDPEMLGDYLGEGGVDGTDKDYWNLIRFNYARAISFVGMNIEQALRHFLTSCGFRLPGEAQKIDRIISTFSQCYWEDNAGDLQRCPFQDQDTVFLISFAIIMLNTDLHKVPFARGKASKKMSRNEFLANLRGVYNSVDKFRDYLYTIYDSIESNPIAISQFSRQTRRIVRPAEGPPLLPFGEEEDFAMLIQSWIRSVKPAQELLRTLAVRHDTFASVENQPDDVSTLRDLTAQMFGANWHHFHGIINSTIEKAHLDLNGLDCCIDVIEFSLCAASYLNLSMERSAFSSQLARVNRFNEVKVKRPTGSKGVSDEALRDQASTELQNLDFECLDQVRDLTKELHNSLHVNGAKVQAMKLVASRIRNGEILLNDPSRTFIREGDLIKRHQLAGRSSMYRFFLFSDVLVYAHKSAQGDYKVHEELPLHLMKVQDNESIASSVRTRSFYIHHPNKSFLVVAPSKIEKMQWVNDIKSSIKREIKRKARIEVARKNLSISDC